MRFSVLKSFKNLWWRAHWRRYCSKVNDEATNDIEKIRNIGILAHIDAGKTTTTERMLFYSGTIRSMGEVHHGNTVTDFMEQERQRGITITSAAVTFPWRDFQINLIDTPGHIDFTMEVEQCLAVLDGAVIVLDGSAGVEAQTLTVWRQAHGARLPRLLYLNKMDRRDADEARCLLAIRDKLDATPLLLHTPLRRDGQFIGLIDILTKEEIIWTQGRGRNYVRRAMTESDGHAYEATVLARRRLVDELSALDDALADAVIQRESLDDLDAALLQAAVRRCTLALTAFPVACGSSYKNIGVQTLLDAVVAFLPPPTQAPHALLHRAFGADLSARAFKLRHDDQRGALTFLRVYSGELTRGQRLYNLRLGATEQAAGLFAARADELRPVDSVRAGGVAVLAGLKYTNSGDLVTTSAAAAGRARAKLVTLLGEAAGAGAEPPLADAVRARLPPGDEPPAPDRLADLLLGVGARVPEPVCVCTVEAASAAALPALEAALAELQREDPSLRAAPDADTGQLVLAGMGELHLEVLRERLLREYRLDVELGPLQIAYRETLRTSAQHTERVDRKIGGARHQITLTMSARPAPSLAPDDLLKLDRRGDSAANLAHVSPRTLAAVRHGVHSALRHGPRVGAPLMDVQVVLHWLEARGAPDAAISGAVVHCLRQVFAEAEPALLEPVMALHVECPESHAARVTADLTRRRAAIQHIELRRGNKVIWCMAPLSELLGYSTALRTLSSGLATFTMEFHSHQHMTPLDEQEAIRRVTGF